MLGRRNLQREQKVAVAAADATEHLLQRIDRSPVDAYFRDVLKASAIAAGSVLGSFARFCWRDDVDWDADDDLLKWRSERLGASRVGVRCVRPRERDWRNRALQPLRGRGTSQQRHGR